MAVVSLRHELHRVVRQGGSGEALLTGEPVGGVLDDTELTLFSLQYGVIFDTRWPSKRYKSTRRFCYIQYTTPSSAQAALALHGTEIEGFKIQVFISDPGRKKGRTDAGANQKELYVAGLSKFTKELDLKRLFEPVS